MNESIGKLLFGFFIGIAALALILGGFSLTAAEGNLAPTETGTPPAATSTSTFTSTAPSPTASATATQTATPTQSATASPSTTPSPTPPADCPPPRGWVPVVVQAGQTLDSLAIQYQTTVSALMSANCLPTTAAPPPGSVIYVPQAVAPTAVTCGAPSGWITYIVQSGDTLYHIADLYRVTVAQLMNANCLTGTTIYVGQRLYVPNVATSTPPFVAPTPTPTGTTTPGTVTDTSTPTSIPTSTPTSQPTATPTPTDTPVPTDTWTPTPTSTPSG